MSADDGAVDDEVFQIRLLGKVLQERFPDTISGACLEELPSSFAPSRI